MLGESSRRQSSSSALVASTTHQNPHLRYNAREFTFASITPENSNLRPQPTVASQCPGTSHLRLQRIRIDICIYNASASIFASQCPGTHICVYNASQLTFAFTTHQNSYIFILRPYLAIRSRLLVMVSSHDSSLGSNAQISSPDSHTSLIAISLSLTAISR